jgi:hypothetical protein
MPTTLSPACPLCGLRFGNKPVLDLHIREDHRQRVPRAQDGNRDPGSIRTAPPADGPAHGPGLAFTPARIAKEAAGGTTRRGRRAGRVMTALREALRAVSAEVPRASQAIIRSARSPQSRPRTPAPPAGQPRKAQRRTAAERADRDDCLICRAGVSF